jgi:hypothetical protein
MAAAAPKGNPWDRPASEPAQSAAPKGNPWDRPGAASASASAPAPKEEDPSFLEDVGAGFMEPVDTAMTSLGRDFDTLLLSPTASRGKMAAAAAKLPLDIAGVPYSLAEGAFQGGVATPVAHGIKAAQGLLGDDYAAFVPDHMDEKGNFVPGKFLSKQEVMDPKYSPGGQPQFQIVDNPNKSRREIASDLTTMANVAGMVAAPLTTGGKTVEAVKGLKKAGQRELPTIEDIFAEADDKFKVFDNATMQLTPDAVKTTYRDLEKKMKALQLDPITEQWTHRAFERMKEVVDKGENVPIQEINQLRKFALKAVKRKGPDAAEDRKAGMTMVEHLYDFMGNLSHHHVAGNEFHPGVLDPGIARSISEANDAYKRASKATVIRDALENAQLSPSVHTVAGITRAIRTEFRRIARNKDTMRRFSHDEQEAIKKMVEGGTFDNAMELMSKFAVRGPGSFAIAEAGGTLAGISPTLIMAGGEAARGISGRLAQRRGENLIDQVLAGPEEAAKLQLGKPSKWDRTAPWVTPAMLAGQSAQHPLAPNADTPQQ